MIEFEMNARLGYVAERLEELISPRLYYIHNRVGGKGWEVRNANSLHTKNFLSRVVIKVENDAIASYIALMLTK